MTDPVVPEGTRRYLELLDELRSLHAAKNAGYSGRTNPDSWANFRQAEGFGVSALLGCLVRLSDKFARVQNLVKDPSNEQVGEKLRDTLMDLAAYSLIAICLSEEPPAAS